MKHRSVVRLAAAGSVIVGSAVGGAVTIASVGAQDDTVTTTTLATDAPAAEKAPGTWVGEVLDGLVTDKTLTREQADKVAAALEAARPERGPGHRDHRDHDGHNGPGRHGFGGDPALIATTIGIDPAALRQALASGQSLAEIATANDVDPQKVIDALVAEVKTNTDEAVAAGKITQERADARLADVTDRITAMVNGEGRGHFGGPRRGPGGHHHGPDGDADDADDAGDVTTTTTG